MADAKTMTDAEWEAPLDAASEAKIDAALERAQHFIPSPATLRVEHDPRLNLLIIHLDNGRRLPIPMEDLPELAGATHEQLLTYEILGPGTGLHFPEIDGDIYIPHLLEGRHLPRTCTSVAEQPIAA